MIANFSNGRVFISGLQFFKFSSGILGVLFDHESCGICCEERRVDTNYNPKGNFTNYFYKAFANYYGDSNENFVVFYVA